MEELVGFRGALWKIRERDSSRKGGGRRGLRKTYELVINPTDNSLDRCTQHFVQPDVCIIHPLRNRLRIYHRSPFEHLPDPPLPTDVFPQSIRVERVRGNFLIVGTGI